MTRFSTVVLLSALTFAAPREASALITGGTGNKPLNDPGWPVGAATIFNHQGRIAWWEGPPFGGGQWHAECRGDAKALNAVLADFAKLDVKSKKIVVHDGAGRSFWLSSIEPKKPEAAKMDWSFTVWRAASWEQLRKMPVDVNPTDPADDSPPSQIDVFTADVDWAQVAVPAGVPVVDQRLTAHGFTAADGVVMEGKVTDAATGRPMTATIRLQRVEPQEKGGYQYPLVVETRADGQGRWVLKDTPPGWMRVVVEAEGFAPRVAGYAQSDGQPCWQPYDCALARAASVSGRVVDEDGKPMAGVDVRLTRVAPTTGGRYESPSEYASKTDADGRFTVDQAPLGSASIRVNAPGHHGPGLGVPVTTPKADVEIRMMRSASLRVTVDFAGKGRAGDYLVKIAPEGGEVVGTYGGSGNIDAENRMNFEVVPPGRYVLTGRPNPGSDSEQTDPVTVELTGGQVLEVTLKAK